MLLIRFVLKGRSPEKRTASGTKEKRAWLQVARHAKTDRGTGLRSVSSSAAWLSWSRNCCTGECARYASRTVDPWLCVAVFRRVCYYRLLTNSAIQLRLSYHTPSKACQEFLSPILSTNMLTDVILIREIPIAVCRQYFMADGGLAWVFAQHPCLARW